MRLWLADKAGTWALRPFTPPPKGLSEYGWMTSSAPATSSPPSFNAATVGWGCKIVVPTLGTSELCALISQPVSAQALFVRVAIIALVELLVCLALQATIALMVPLPRLHVLTGPIA